MRRTARSLCGTALVLSWSQPPVLSAQISPLQVEVRGGAAVPAQEFADPGGLAGEADPGASFGVHFSLAQGHLSWYVGFSESRFACGGAACGEDFVSTGWDLGVRLNLASGPVIPWIKIGTTAQIAEGRLTDPLLDPLPGEVVPTFPAESSRAWGLEVGAGVMLRVAERFGLNPGVRYLTVNTSFSGRDVGALNIRAWVVDLGLVLGF